MFTMRRLASGLLLAVTVSLVARGAPLTEGNLVISRVGGTEDDLLNFPDSASRVRLLEINPADGSIVQEIRLPALASEITGSNSHRLTLGSDFRAGLLHRSTNGLFLVIGGYDADAKNGPTPGTALVNRTLSSVVNRVIARIDNSGGVDTTTAISFVSTVTSSSNGLYEGSQGSFRSVATDDGTRFWLSGRNNDGNSSRKGRVQYCLYQASSSIHVPTSSNSGNEFEDARVTTIFNGQLYGVWNIESTTRNEHRGVYTIGTGLPTTQGQTTVNLPNVWVEPPSDSPYDFYMANGDTVYLCDDNFPSDNGGLQKYVRDTDPQSPTFGLLVYKYVLNAGLPVGIQTVRAVTGTTDNNGHVVLYAITAANPVGGDRGNALVTVTDTGCPTGAEPGCSAADTFTTLTTAGDLEVFRGVTFAPRPCVGAECTGACCQPGHSCIETTADACAASGGVFRGIQTTCATSVCPLICHTPFADADGDGDVDMDDFGQFQRCITGSATTVSGDCTCFDRPEESFPTGNGHIDQVDFNAFVNCVSGSSVPADPNCGG